MFKIGATCARARNATNRIALAPGSTKRPKKPSGQDFTNSVLADRGLVRTVELRQITAILRTEGVVDPMRDIFADKCSRCARWGTNDCLDCDELRVDKQATPHQNEPGTRFPSAANSINISTRHAPSNGTSSTVRPERASVVATAATTSSSDASGAWTRAASALRVGDQARAIEALTELSTSHDATTRDAALLSRAQLDLAAGRRASAIPVLQGLASTGATAFVRRRAAEILASDKK